MGRYFPHSSLVRTAFHALQNTTCSTAVYKFTGHVHGGGVASTLNPIRISTIPSYFLVSVRHSTLNLDLIKYSEYIYMYVHRTILFYICTIFFTITTPIHNIIPCKILYKKHKTNAMYIKSRRCWVIHYFPRSPLVKDDLPCNTKHNLSRSCSPFI